ncbi:hypothetical protein FHT82_004948 [Rhizobium sp. BK275]|uniref:Uncharacterized protein n=1 Tax=Rhizobium viscosum TaxID=1673 RepID=A0ABR9IQ82_RHIVS|nr:MULTISPECIES: hypothetical protein [Rhizobium]MBB3392167.1 hypothetical protein [Rhizobium sp. BK275]MBE1505346.1 hypothetical protein [Rhizobium viscosum]
MYHENLGTKTATRRRDEVFAVSQASETPIMIEAVADRDQGLRR